MNTTESKVREYLVSNNIFPFSVLFIQDLPLLKISFYLQDDIQDFLEVSKLGFICDNFGLQEVKDSILLRGTVLSKFLSNV